MSAEHVWIENPATGGVWACPVDAVAREIARGWEKCDAPESDDSHLRDPKPAPVSAPRKSGD